MTPGASRGGAAWRSLTGTGPAAAAVLGLLVFACVFVAVAGPRENLALRTRALRHGVASASPLARSVSGSVDYTAFSGELLGRPPGPGDLAATRARLGAGLRREGLPLAPAGTGWSALASGFFPVTGAPRQLYRGNVPPQLEVSYRERLMRHARLVAGRLPVSARLTPGGGVFQVAVTTATAARFGLRPGSRLGLRNGSPAGIVLAVTGVVQPGGAGSAFWAADPIAARPALMERSSNLPAFWNGAAFIGAGELPLLPRRFDPSSLGLSWGFPLELGSLTADQAPAVVSELTAASTRAGLPSAGTAPALGQPAAITLSSGMTGLLTSFVAQNSAAGQVASLLSVSLSVTGLVVLLLGAQLLADRRRGEFAVMQARGASSRQLALLALGACAVAAVPAAAAAGGLATGLTSGYPAPVAWVLAAITVLVALASTPAITLRGYRVARLRAGPGRQARVTGRARIGRLAAETAACAAAAGGLIAAHQQAQPGGGSTGSATLAPVLVAVPAAILIARCYPLLMRALLRLARIRPGIAAFVGFARAAMTPPRAVLPVFALVLALSVVAFGATVRSAILRGETAVSWQRTGADAVIDASAAQRPLTPAAQRAIAAVPGVRRTAAVTVTAGSAHGTSLTVIAVSPTRYAALMAATPAAAFPAATLARPASPGGPVPVLASPAAAALLGRGNSVLAVDGRRLTIRVRGTAPEVPGAHGQARVVLSKTALGSHPPAPGILLAVGPQLDGRRLTAAARRAVPGAAVTLRSAVLASLSGAPLPHSAYLAVAAATATAAVLSVVIVLLMLALGSRDRDVTVARLRVLGLGPGQARWLVALEVLPQILAATAGGTACAWILAQLAGPALNLLVFTGSSAAVVRAQPGPLAAAAAGLIFLAVVTMAAEAVTISRRRAARALPAGG